MVNSVTVVSTGEKGGGGTVQITGARQSGRKGAWAPNMLLMFYFYFSVVSLFVDCTN